MFNELVLGQRIPKVSLIDKQSDSPLMGRQYVPCLHRNTIHNGLLWSKRNAFGCWFEHVCQSCHNIIPCLWNITSILLLTITFPIWGWFKTSLKNKWLRNRIERLQDVSGNELPTAQKTSWLKMGLLYAAFMFCVMALPDIIREKATYTDIGIQVIIWLVAGLLFGGLMQLILGQSKSKKE